MLSIKKNVNDIYYRNLSYNFLELEDDYRIEKTLNIYPVFNQQRDNHTMIKKRIKIMGCYEKKISSYWSKSQFSSNLIPQGFI